MRVSNLDRAQDLVCSEHVDIVLISETWLNGNILDHELFPLLSLLSTGKTVRIVIVVASLLLSKVTPSSRCRNMCRIQKIWRT